MFGYKSTIRTYNFLKILCICLPLPLSVALSRSFTHSMPLSHFGIASLDEIDSAGAFFAGSAWIIPAGNLLRTNLPVQRLSCKSCPGRPECQDYGISIAGAQERSLPPNQLIIFSRPSSQRHDLDIQHAKAK